MSGDYKERVSKAFEKLHFLQETVEDQKVTKYKLVTGFISNFESKLDEIATKKQQKFELILDKIKALNDAANEQKTKRQQVQAEINRHISNVEKNCLRMIEASRQERVEVERKMSYQLNAQLNLLVAEINKRSITDTHNGFLDSVLQEDVVRLKQDLSTEISKRRQAEEKIFTQFTQQMAKIKEGNERDKLQKHNREQQILSYIKDIGQNIRQKIFRMKKQRESNESQTIALIENIIQKLKKEMTQLRY